MGQPGCNTVGHTGSVYYTTEEPIIKMCKTCKETDCQHVGSNLCGHVNGKYCNHGGYIVKKS
jgi:hypothetical protein